jgi:hypothetical protein
VSLILKIVVEFKKKNNKNKNYKNKYNKRRYIKIAKSKYNKKILVINNKT